MSHGDGPKITIDNDPDFLAAANGAVDPSDGVRPPAPPRRNLRPGDMLAVPAEAPVSTPVETPAETEILPPLNAETPQPVAPVNPDVRPGTHDAVPEAQALYDVNRRKNSGSVVVEINHEMQHKARRVVQVYHIVTSDPKRRFPVGTGVEHGIPLTVFGVPTETGRRYRVTVEEVSDSRPQPKKVPWGNGQTV